MPFDSEFNIQYFQFPNKNHLIFILNQSWILINKYYQPDSELKNKNDIYSLPPILEKEKRYLRLETLKYRTVIEDPELFEEFVNQLVQFRK